MSDVARLADDIVAHGVTRAFGVPGSGVTLSLIDALERRRVPFHLTHFEGAGALMAATVGRLSGYAGLSLSIKGPGLVNAAPGIAAAWFEAFPLVHVTEAFAPDAPAAQAHKRMDQAILAAAVTKAVRHHAKSGPGFSELARFACAEEQGPVVLEIAPVPAPSAAPLAETESVHGDLPAVLDLVRRAERPVAIAGALAVRRDLGNLLSFLPFPVFSTAAAKGIVDEGAANAAGVFTGVGLELTPERVVLDRCDLVVGVGLTAREALAVKPFSAPFVAIEAVATAGTDTFAPAARAHIDSADEILKVLADKAWGLDELGRVLAALQSRMLEGFLPGAVFRAIENRFRHNARVVLDTGYFCTIGEHALRAARPELCLMSGQGRYMGTGLPMALGASLHDPATPTLAVLGNGGIAMYLAEVKLAARHRLPLLVMLMTDNSFSSIRTRAIKDGLTQKPLTMDGKSWVPVFDALGVPGTRAENLSAVEAALAAWKPENGPAFLEIPFAPEPYEAMVAGIR